MAWPLTPLLTFVNSSSPACDATFLNSLQTGVNGMVAGTYSYAGLVVDGTGGVASTPTAGGLKLSAAAASTSMPTTTLATRTLYKEMIPLAGGAVHNNAGVVSLVWGFGISTIQTPTPSAGVHNITLAIPVANISNAIVLAIGNATQGTGFANQCTALIGGGGATAQVIARSSSGTAIDSADFYFVVYGG